MTSNATKPHTSLVKQAHELIRQHLIPGDIAIDATVGNGHDTRFMLDLVRPNGKVFGFDIQQSALDSAQEKLADLPFLDCLTLHHASHADMIKHIPATYHGKVKAVMFNLGYLPGGDKQVITQTDTTLTALNQACALLSANGTITVVAYPGHPGGSAETDQVNLWCENLDRNHFRYEHIRSPHTKPTAPELFSINKITAATEDENLL